MCQNLFQHAVQTLPLTRLTNMLLSHGLKTFYTKHRLIGFNIEGFESRRIFEMLESRLDEDVWHGLHAQVSGLMVNQRCRRA